MKKVKTKIAFFLPSLEGGGAEKNTVNLLRNIDKNVYDVSLVLAEKKGDFLKNISNSVDIFDLKTKNKFYLAILLKLINYFKNERPDILVSAFPHFNIFCLLAKQISGAKTKIVVTEHVGLLSLPGISSSAFNGLVSKYFLPFFVKIFYPKADAIICVSRGVADDLKKIIKKDLNFVIIHNPVDVEEIEKLSEEGVDHEWFSDKNVPIMAMAGRLIKQKDYPTAFSALAEVNKVKKVRMIILGRGSEEEKLKELVNQMELADKVLFLGFQKNPYKFISKSSVFVLSSIVEGFGNVLVEAMVCKTPVISTNCPVGPDEIIENNRNGILVPVKSPRELADAILKILGDQNFKNDLVNEASERARDFSAQKIFKQYEKVMNNL